MPNAKASAPAPLTRLRIQRELRELRASRGRALSFCNEAYSLGQPATSQQWADLAETLGQSMDLLNDWHDELQAIPAEVTEAA